MIDLQETGTTNVNLGGFRTPQEGFVTSYATTQSIEVFGYVDNALKERANPARTFDFLCRVEGVHHSDPQDLIKIRHRTVTMNGWAGSILLCNGVLTGATIIAMAVGLQRQLGDITSHALVVRGMIPPALSIFAFACVRLPATPNRRIAAAIFAGFTTLLLPILKFLLA